MSEWEAPARRLHRGLDLTSTGLCAHLGELRKVQGDDCVSSRADSPGRPDGGSVLGLAHAQPQLLQRCGRLPAGALAAAPAAAEQDPLLRGELLSAGQLPRLQGLGRALAVGHPGVAAALPRQEAVQRGQALPDLLRALVRSGQHCVEALRSSMGLLKLQPLCCTGHARSADHGRQCLAPGRAACSGRTAWPGLPG